MATYLRRNERGKVTPRKIALHLHRWVSLTLMAFWLFQALTGVLIVFHWEMDDALLTGESRPVDLDAIERRLDLLAPEGSSRSVDSVWTSGGQGNRFDVFLDAPQGSSVVRIDGAGKVLRDRSDDELLANGGWKDTLVGLHHNLLGGDLGSWIVGISGVLLLNNLVLGAWVAWPRRGRWRQSLKAPTASAPAAAKTYGWHRMLGLWVVVPAMLTVATGIMLVFSGVTESIVDPEPVAVAAESPGQQADFRSDIRFATAVRSALGVFPTAQISGVSFPSEDEANYRIRLLQPDEIRRVYGTTTVFVSGADGRVIASFDALEDGPGRSFVDGLFPFHTGEMGGLLGRIAVVGIGLWLITMIVLGFLLWQRRRRGRQSN